MNVNVYVIWAFHQKNKSQQEIPKRHNISYSSSSSSVSEDDEARKEFDEWKMLTSR